MGWMGTEQPVGRQRRPPAGSRSGVILAVIVVVLGVLVSATVGGVLAHAQERAAERAIRHHTTLAAEAVVAEARRYVDTVQTVAAAVGAVDNLTAAKFAQVTRPLQTIGLAGAASIGFLVPATDDQIGAVQARWRARGVPDLVLDAQGDAREHIFTTFYESLDGIAPPMLGTDLSQSPAPTRALDEARRTGGVTVSDTYQLLRDRNLPPDKRQLSFVLAAPVYAVGSADDSRPFRGWVLMGLRGQDFIGVALSRIARGVIDVTLSAINGDSTRTAVATLRTASGRRHDLHESVNVRVAQREWQLSIDATSSTLPGASSPLPWAMTGASLLLTAVLAVLVFVLGSSRARARAQVATATADLRRAEAEASRQAGLLTAVLDTVSDGVEVISPRGEFLFRNPVARRMLGARTVHSVQEMLSLQEMLDGPPRGGDPADRGGGSGVYTLDGDTEIPLAKLPVIRALAGESIERTPVVIRDPERSEPLVLSVSAHPLDPAAGQPGAVAVFRDITARTRADEQRDLAVAALQEELGRREATEADLAAQKDYLVQILDAIDVTVVTCDTTGAIVHANRVARAALPATGAPDTVAAATPQVRMAHLDGTPMQVAETPLMRALHGEQVNGLEALVVRPDGAQRAIMLHSRPLRRADGTIVGAVGSSFDFTVLREREAELAAFAGVVAHDLRSPLSIITGFTALVRESLDAAGQVEHLGDLDRVLSTTARMAELIDDLLSYSAARDGTLTPTDVDLNALVDDVLDERLAAVAADPHTPAPQLRVGPLPHVSADAGLVRQLLDNLIGNAIKYTEPGQPAQITIDVGQATAGHECIEIADRGIGIPAGQHHAIFIGFHRAHPTAGYAGTGLGLAICHRVVQRHGGTLTAYDNPGGGTRFRFTLPAVSPRSPDAADS